jgi:hypothetical protein
MYPLVTSTVKIQEKRVTATTSYTIRLAVTLFYLIFIGYMAAKYRTQRSKARAAILFSLVS